MIIMLGSAARRVLEGFLIGRITESIIERLTCPALVNRYGGFVSPVRIASGTVWHAWCT